MEKKKKEKENIEKKKYSYDLFGFIKIAFTNQKEFNTLNVLDKERQSFMFNRFMSIMYPIQACLLSDISMSGAHVVDFWQSQLTKKYNRVPGWMYVKTAKKREEKKNLNGWYPKTETIYQYCKINKIDSKVFNETMEIFEKDFLEELKEFEMLLEGKHITKKVLKKRKKVKNKK